MSNRDDLFKVSLSLFHSVKDRTNQFNIDQCRYCARSCEWHRDRCARCCGVGHLQPRQLHGPNRCGGLQEARRFQPKEVIIALQRPQYCLTPVSTGSLVSLRLMLYAHPRSSLKCSETCLWLRQSKSPWLEGIVVSRSVKPVLRCYRCN